MIVGTAGHIDHGKTSLVRGLTGVDTDRLEQEKTRGISIELGYAYTPLPDGNIMGFVDVPGHERLVHTMVAGAAGIDFGLLVVAADDGVMPQTREHLAILELLGVETGAIALSKVDRVDAARVAAVEEQIRDTVASSFLSGAPLFSVCAIDADDSGLEALRAYLHAQAAALADIRHHGLFRLAIDRSFTLQGRGTVVTGTVFSGHIDLADQAADLRLMPSGRRVRIRGLRSQDQYSTYGRVGQRCALNLAGLDKDEVKRGDWVADARCFTPSVNMDVTLTLLASAERPLKTWAAVHVHIGAAHHVARVVPLCCETVLPEETAKVQLVFDRPACAITGDRFIVRDAQARTTLGGGRVLDPQAPDRKRRTTHRLAWLDGAASLADGGGLDALLAHSPWGLDESALRRVGLLVHDGRLRALGAALGDVALPADSVWAPLHSDSSPRVLILKRHWDALADALSARLDDYHHSAPDEPGIDLSRLKRMAFPRLSPVAWQALVQDMFAAKRISRNGPWIHRPYHRVALSTTEAALGQTLLARIHAGGFDPPWTRDLARDCGHAEDAVRALLRKLVRHGVLFQVVHDLFYHRDHVSQLAALVTSLAAESEGVHAAQFRDATGLGRKRAVQLLEFFNRIGYTRRLRDAHLLRSDTTLFLSTERCEQSTRTARPEHAQEMLG